MNIKTAATRISNNSLLLSRHHHHHQKVYAKCTKTKKMEISRGIVEHIRTLTPPGRFLEKDPLTLFWKEVDAKRAHEKTAQALRDGAAPMRKRFSDETAADSVSSNDHEERRAKKSHKKMRVTSTEPPILSKTEELEEIIDVKLHLQSPIFSETSIYSWLLLPEPPFKVTPIESPQLRVDEFGLPFHLVNCKENDVPMDMVDMRDDEIVRLWVAC